MRILLSSILFLSFFTTSAFAYKEADLKKLLETNSCQECDLSSADLSGKNLEKADLAKCKFK